MRKEERGEGEVLGLVGLAILGVFVYGLWAGGVAVWEEVFPSKSALVRCYSGSQQLLEVVAKGGVRKRWGTRSVTDRDNGREITIDNSATCVVQEWPTKEEAALWWARAHPQDPRAVEILARAANSPAHPPFELTAETAK